MEKILGRDKIITAKGFRIFFRCKLERFSKLPHENNAVPRLLLASHVYVISRTPRFHGWWRNSEPLKPEVEGALHGNDVVEAEE